MLIVLSFLIVSNLKKTNTLTVFAQADTNYGDFGRNSLNTAMAN